MLPAGREVGIKVGCRWFKEQTRIDCTRTADGATDECVHIVFTSEIGRGREYGIVESRHVDTTQVGAIQPMWSLGPSGNTVRWTTSLEEKDFLSGFTQSAGNDDSGRTGANYDYIPHGRRP